MAKELVELCEEHFRKVASGEAARTQGSPIHIDESIDKQLRRLIESFLNSAVRTLKHGMQDLAAELQVNIGFMFKQRGAFDTGIMALQASDPLLAEYLRHTRAWSERLIESRNAIEHKNWTLPRIGYTQTGNSVTETEPMISGQPVTELVKLMRYECLKRLDSRGLELLVADAAAAPGLSHQRGAVAVPDDGLSAVSD